jgi:erythromycin esterase-like protein
LYSLASQELQARCSGNLHEARLWLVTHRDGYVAARGASAYEWALRMADLLIQQEAFLRLGEHPQSLVAVNLRDRAMAHKVNWAVGHLEPGVKAVLWAHNGHINKLGTASPGAAPTCLKGVRHSGERVQGKGAMQRRDQSGCG